MTTATETAWPPPLATPQTQPHPSLPPRPGYPVNDKEPERQQGDREQEPGVREKQQS